MTDRKTPTIHDQVTSGAELDVEQSARAKEHAVECPECRAMLAADTLLSEFFEEPPQAVSAAFVRETLAKSSSRGPVAPLWWATLPVSWRLGIAALLVLAALGGYAVGGGRPAPACAEPTLTSLLGSPELMAMRAEARTLAPGGQR